MISSMVAGRLPGVIERAKYTSFPAERAGLPLSYLKNLTLLRQAQGRLRGIPPLDTPWEITEMRSRIPQALDKPEG
jgi:hypothetical protein